METNNGVSDRIMKEVIDEINRTLSVVLAGLSGFSLALAYFKEDPAIKTVAVLTFITLFGLTCLAYRWTKRME